MTEKLYLITDTQCDNYLQIMRNNMHDPDAYNAIADLQSLPVVDSNPVAYWHQCIKIEHPKSDPKYWPTALKLQYMEKEILELRARKTLPQSPTPEGAGSDWFYRLQFICRVLQGENPDKTDMQTALGVAQSLKRDRWTADKALTSITADDVTDEMLQVFLDALDTPMNYRATVAAAYDAVVKHRGMK